jgi:rhodanese-related sulfurtransferase
MRKSLTVLLLGLGLALSAQAQPRPISPKDAKAMLAARKGIVLLDVRTREEYVAERIPDSILLPYDQIDAASAAKIIGPKDRTVIVYCRSGRRSAIAAQALAALGYRDILDLGGIQSWPYEIVKGEPRSP